MVVNIRKLKFNVLLLMVVLANPTKTQVWTLQQCIDTAQAREKTWQ